MKSEDGANKDGEEKPEEDNDYHRSDEQVGIPNLSLSHYLSLVLSLLCSLALALSLLEALSLSLCKEK